MNFLISGGAGFIGFHLSKFLLEEGHNVYAFDYFSDYYSVNLKKRRLVELRGYPNYTFLELDLLNRRSLAELVLHYSPDTFVHLAAQPGVRLPLNQYDRYARENLMGFHSALTTAVELKVPSFLFASSSSVYGNDSTAPYKETETNLRPISYYGASKLANEVLASSIAGSSHTRIRGLRFFTVYGSWGRPDMAYFRAINTILSGAKFVKYGNGNVRRDFTHVTDTVKAIGLLSNQLMKCPPGFMDIVNVGGGNPYSLNDLLLEIEQQVGTSLNFMEEESVENDVELTVADDSRLKELTGFTPQVTLKAGIAETIQWASSSEIAPLLKLWKLE